MEAFPESAITEVAEGPSSEGFRLGPLGIPLDGAGAPFVFLPLFLEAAVSVRGSSPRSTAVALPLVARDGALS